MSEAFEHSNKRPNPSPRKPRKKRRKTLNLPPPIAVIDNYHDPNLCISEEEREAKFKGKQRSAQHVPGNYASFVFLPISLDPKRRLDQVALKCIYSLVHTENTVELPATLTSMISHSSFSSWIHSQEDTIELHISLSRLCTLRKDQISSFVDKVAAMSESQSSHRIFALEFRNFAYLLNDDKTTSFLTITSSPECPGHSNVQTLLQDVDNIMKYFEFEPYYKESIPHISIGWKNVESCKEEYQSLQERELEQYFEIQFSTVACKIGNKIYTNKLHRN